MSNFVFVCTVTYAVVHQRMQKLGDSPSRALGRVKTAIYEACDTKNVSLTHEKYRYDTAINHRYKTIFFWCYNTYGMPQF